MAEDGTCPTCGRSLGAPALTRTEPRAGESPAGERSRPRVPWHFWVMVSALGLYLGFRLVQGIGLLFDWLV